MFVCLSVNFFSVKDFSATIWVRILKFGTKLDSDELYCVTKVCNKRTATYCLSVLLLVHFSFSPLEIAVFLYPQYEVYRGYIVFAFSVIMFVCLSVCKLFSVKDLSATTLVRILKFGNSLIVMSCIV